MTPRALKTANPPPDGCAADTSDTVSIMLARIRAGGEPVVRDYAATLDRWHGDIRVPDSALQAASGRVPKPLRDALDYAHDNIRSFASAQRASLSDFEIALRPGLVAGQKAIPVSAAGCYVPGGRYAHVASALMTIATAKAAGVGHITACAPPRDADGIAPEVLHAMRIAGADRVLCLGGVQAVAAMAWGHFGVPEADILCGPGNAFVAEAKRQLFGPVGIDMVAGPTDVMILADRSADPDRVALDLAGQAEHGAASPCWLVTDDAALAAAVLAAMPGVIAALPEPNRGAAQAAWDALGEVILCDTREDMAAVADTYAPEHLHVQAQDPDWWLARLKAYGSLFLGAGSTVAFGDKAAGPNHVLPTGRAARHTGGLSVMTFLKTVTWQRVTPDAVPQLAGATATIARAEGMIGHAWTAEARLADQRAAAGCAGPGLRTVNGERP